MAQPQSYRLFGIPYNPIIVNGADLIYVFSTATVFHTGPPEGTANVFYQTADQVDYQNPNLCVVTNDGVPYWGDSI